MYSQVISVVDVRAMAVRQGPSGSCPARDNLPKTLLRATNAQISAKPHCRDILNRLDISNCLLCETLSLSQSQFGLGLMKPEHCVTKAAMTGQFQEDQDVGVDTSHGHSAMDYAQHNQTYSGFLKITKYAIVFLVLLLAAMKYFLV